jgi:4-amino-4-deoxy-L-arabinose transferase-like glycosyltransferase
MAFTTNPQIRTQVLLVASCAFLFFYGLGAFGLIGADEPRYAQVAREMLSRHDWVTPTLQGKAWLEKPVLYYWQAMLSFLIGGVTDKTARVPTAVDASILIAAIYYFLRNFRPGSELDGALITASCAGVVGFARAAATDMPLAATFGISLLTWYAWYENKENESGRGGRVYLAAFYFVLALGTLAKGPVAPALAAIIIFVFLALKREWRALSRTLWIPGILLYLAATLPWYVAVQIRNPDFFRTFILEHNLARFSQDVYHHRQPFWFYIPVFLLAMTPWTVVLIVAIADRLRGIWSKGKETFSNREDSWPLFLLIWMFVPIIFFSASQSKLPGYILPAVPAGALLIAESLNFRRGKASVDGIRGQEERKLSPYFAIAHGVLCGTLVFAAFSARSLVINRHLLLTSETYIGAVVAAIAAIGISAALVSRAAIRVLTRVTLVAMVISVAVVIRTASVAIDASQSSRPIAESIQSFSQEPVPVATYNVNRAQRYGLEFYLNRSAEAYESGKIPTVPHVLVAKHNTQLEVATLVPGRRVSYLTSIPAQNLDLYWVGKQ